MFVFIRISQNYLAIIPTKKCIKCLSGTTWIELWKSNRISQETIENTTKSNSNFAPTFVDHHLFRDMNFIGLCLIKSNIYIPKNLITMYISYTLGTQLRN